MLEIELQSIKDHTATAQENRTKQIDKLLNENKVVQEKIDFFSNNEEETRELKNKLNKINKDIKAMEANIEAMKANIDKIDLINASQLQLDEMEQRKKTIDNEEQELKELEEEKKNRGERFG